MKPIRKPGATPFFFIRFLYLIKKTEHYEYTRKSMFGELSGDPTLILIRHHGTEQQCIICECESTIKDKHCTAALLRLRGHSSHLGRFWYTATTRCMHRSSLRLLQLAGGRGPALRCPWARWPLSSNLAAVSFQETGKWGK